MPFSAKKCVFKINYYFIKITITEQYVLGRRTVHTLIPRYVFIAFDSSTKRLRCAALIWYVYNILIGSIVR